MTKTNSAKYTEQIEAVRRFNRFYTQQIGVLHEGILKSSFSLTEARIIYELAHYEKLTATQIANKLDLDAGYLSRILREFKKRGLIDKQPSETDGRQTILCLTEQGQNSFTMLNACSHDEIGAILDKLSTAEQSRLIKAMQVIEELLGTRLEQKVPYILRLHQPGDLGWIVHRHGVLYAEEYGWNEQFEALVASIVAEFVQNYDSKRERCWIAERDDEIVGSVCLVTQSDEVAKLRLLFVEPKVRGLGIGTRLVNECVRFARQAGYSKVTLWTNNILLAARHIYEVVGFRLVHEEEHDSFGHHLIGEVWELDL
ncbi:helix-turn-helix domain-containing GNAT family N-acetyltransferase [Gloeocapsopsis sp. IPPAS B-1203]|uniref:bifunctional helix-turn-helix transcriptional regulator/GNAT family N-acetyltransferase n=1 Tax=Gloeocapsopsis sp. IPPAS B-1203 TaxID=2049454 RepID=UPI000C17F089|nr:helix-turn-helix domain-containing GNAT family N-acetyltransferase [Gloeocapsopsis sp. IPPAS B-1203]PIG91912.1 MarR family transcriptional regulator [Gloeocapsopsis sp. IPPAS B-1203]